MLWQEGMVSHLTGEIFELKEKGYPNSEIALKFNLSLKQVKNLVARENRKRKQCLNRVVLNNQNQLQAVVDEFISFYNYERINKDGFTPYEMRSRTI